MKKRNILIVAIVLILIILFSLIYHFWDRRSWALNLPSSDSVVSITIEQNSNTKNINDNNDIEDIMNVVIGVKRTTKEESIQDYPTNVEKEIIINFNSDNKSSTIFVYKKKNKYYIEQAYNGIYRISADEYNSIEKYIR